MNRCVWIILNKNFEMMLDGEVYKNKVKDKKFSPGGDIWTEEIPRLGFSDAGVQKDYDDFVSDILTLFAEPSVSEVFINAKIGEESEYINCKSPLIIRKIEEYIVDEITSKIYLANRNGELEEYAYLICFLASDKAAYISGQDYRIDGCRKKN